MNMQQMLIQAQKLQREMQKQQAELEQKEFTINKNGAVVVVVKGDKTIKSISVDEDAFEKENKEMVEESIALAINEAIEKIKSEEEAIQSKVAGAGKLF